MKKSCSWREDEGSLASLLHPHLTLDKLKLGSKVLIRNLTYFTSKFYALISMEHICIMAVLLHVCL